MVSMEYKTIKCRESVLFFVTINFSKFLSKKFTFILQEFHFLENKDTADIMNFHIKTILFFKKRP